MSVNFEHFKVFYYVAKYSSISEAARNLFISQPAVSQTIKLLETELDTTLFLRAAKGVSLTKQGEELYEYVQRGCDFFFMAESHFTEERHTGEIKIGAHTAVLKFYLLERLERFTKANSDIKISIITGTTPEIIKSLSTGDIDIGLVLGPIKKSAALKVKTLSTFQDVFVAGKRFQHLKYRTAPLKSLQIHPLILAEHDMHTRQYIDDFAEKHNINITAQYELSAPELIVDFAAKGMGIGCVIRDYAQSLIKDGQLFELGLETPIPPREIFAISSAKFSPSPFCKRFTDSLLL